MLKPVRSTDPCFEHLVASDRHASGREFVAPCRPGAAVRCPCSGMVQYLPTTSPFLGWGYFRRGADGRAEVLREARPDEIRRFPSTAVLYIEDGFGVLMRSLVLKYIRLSEAAQRFDTLDVWLDGRDAWSMGPAATGDPRHASRLRNAWSTGVHDGLTPWESRLLQSLPRQAVSATLEERLRSALAFAGAALVSHQQHGDTLRVRWQDISGPHESVLRADDLTVLSSGVCLSGRDSDFDIAALVGVMRERRG